MGVGKWWKQQSGGLKVVTALAALMTLQLGLYWTTQFTVLPTYETIFGPSRDSELGLGLIIWQGLLCGVTGALLAGSIIVVGVSGGFSKKKDSGEDSND